MLAHYWQTTVHKFWVFTYLIGVIGQLIWRGVVHDLSKYGSAESEGFAKTISELRATTYGSEEYELLRKRLKTALDHHYAHNSHHPEYYPDGIRGMSLLDVVEMWCDWRAAVRRHDDSDIRRSIVINKRRFGYGEDLFWILMNMVAPKDGEFTYTYVPPASGDDEADQYLLVMTKVGRQIYARRVYGGNAEEARKHLRLDINAGAVRAHDSIET